MDPPCCAYILEITESRPPFRCHPDGSPFLWTDINFHGLQKFCPRHPPHTCKFDLVKKYTFGQSYKTECCIFCGKNKPPPHVTPYDRW
jgi:hypothetical protein